MHNPRCSVDLKYSFFFLILCVYDFSLGPKQKTESPYPTEERSCTLSQDLKRKGCGPRISGRNMRIPYTQNRRAFGKNSTCTPRCAGHQSTHTNKISPIRVNFLIYIANIKRCSYYIAIE